MDNIDIIINNLLQTLEGIELPDGVSLIREFPGSIKDNPLTKTTVSYGIKEIAAFYDFNVYEEGMIADVTLGFTVHAPITSSGESCREIFISIIQYLYPLVPLLKSFGCGELKFNRSTATIELEGYGIVRHFM